ncbi:protein MODIFIER OF SNC1 1-like [Mangifera indica]|uniref:protein MODIFIER OF SNC1 1-like n=1 Tax=Mangifera indica TaxID=29780 RepID=UPI001CFB5AF2|nr:protein MODIFIER OF SNC1 1-like [Mangifera indica]XP_044476387.1 protein MODIFIER OF SNC1 1-like [Mangifera indica]XP_044476388.1 protein MODIFIER OF SNC1 1-like [Mangifera indica]XP_044476389.1 protein MODIFIER OF SNC1 1-like [Mangifera indica]
MTSSMLTGERRWASARRGGMTVLGKVAVPKPINLPSQKLENHGLDPNVEIVPKGTLSWGSKSSSSGSNAWGYSTFSPNADGGTGSPSHLSGCPSSGGSGTRPSTSSSDRAHEPVVGAWGSNSRPSSASGVLTSNQSSAASLRPRSAETRPGSSQLSRFAEPLSDNSVAWGSAATAEKLGVKSSRNDGFSLTSGDFPTLGAEKDNVGKNTEPQDNSSHGQLEMSSGGEAPGKDKTEISVPGDVSVNTNVRSGTANCWRRDNIPFSEDGGRPNLEKWQADPHGPHPYPNAAMPPQHYEAWRGPPINNHPGGVWYRGPPINNPGGPPYPPGGFPMEPFHFYHPSMPGATLPNPQPVPPLGAGPRAHHPKNVDMYRPSVPDAYMRPGMPLRPAFYPGPVAYEGYYGPPMSYHNPNERDVPFMGMAAGPSAYNRYLGKNAHDPSNSYPRSGGYGPNGKGMTSEQAEPTGHPLDGRGPYRVLLKQQDGWVGRDEEQKWEDTVPDVSHEKGDQPRALSWEDDWRRDHQKDEEFNLKGKPISEEASFQASDNVGGSSVPVKVKSPQSVGMKAFDGNSVKKLEHPAIVFPENPGAPKDSSLIQKIEGLNAKVRATDGRYDLMSVSGKEEQKNKPQIVNHEDDHSANEAAANSLCPVGSLASGSNNPAVHDSCLSAGDRSVELAAASGTVISRRSAHAMHGRTDHRGKGRFNSQEIDGWRKKSPIADCSSAHSESSIVHMQDQALKEAAEESGSYLQGKDELEPMPPMSDDSQAQRAKMRELAKQRVKQRQKEEEERARDQKAKALAKLEELNRRTQTVESLTQQSEIFPSVDVQNKQEESQCLVESMKVASKSGASILGLVSNSIDVAQSSESGSVLSNELLPESPRSAHKEPVGMHKHNESVPTIQDVIDSVHQNNAPQVYDGSMPRQKWVSYKQKQNIQSERNSSEKFISNSTTESLKGRSDLIVNTAISIEVVTNEIAPGSESSLSSNPNVIVESSVHQKRRNNRSGKKHKVEEASPVAALPVVTETHIINTSSESSKMKASEPELDSNSIQLPTDHKNANQTSDMRLSSPTDENHGRANNQWKFQHPHRMSRSTQANKSGDKFHSNDVVVWAPVLTQNKVEVAGDASEKSVVEASSVKSNHQLQNNSRNKRAEMERYIPKPVAKEMAQQGSIQQNILTPPVDHTMPHEIVARAESGSLAADSSQAAGIASGKMGVAMESKMGDSRQNKQGKTHVSWRQRSSSDVQGKMHDAQSSNTSRNVQKLTEPFQPQKPDVISVKEQPKYYDDWGSDGWNMPEIPDSAVPLTVPVAKDQGMTGRGKRHQYKGQKGTGNNINSRDSDKSFVQSSVPALEVSQSHSHSASKEIRTSHWLPKPQTFSACNDQGSWPSSGQNVGAEIGRDNKKDHGSQGGLQRQPQSDKETNEVMAHSHRGQSASHTSRVDEATNAGNEETKRERRIASVKGRPPFPNQGPGDQVETCPSNADIQHEQRMPSGFCTNGNQRSRFGKGHESRGDWSTSGQDNRQQNQPVNRERQRHNSQYEYQPVGLYNNSNSSRANNYEGSKDAPNNAGGRYRERSQSHSRRGGGNFHGRQSGSVRVADGSYD